METLELSVVKYHSKIVLRNVEVRNEKMTIERIVSWFREEAPEWCRELEVTSEGIELRADSLEHAKNNEHTSFYLSVQDMFEDLLSRI